MIFEGKKAIVTGGSRGIGKSVAFELARNGADVAVLAQNLERAEAVASEIVAMGRNSIAISVDVSSYKQVVDAVDSVYSMWGNIDFLVNSAGIVKDAILLRLSPEEWDQVISVNLTGVYNCTKAVLKNMVSERKGKIVNITSVIGVTGGAGQANYAASKAGIIGFTKSCAKEVASRGITINAVAPGFIETDMTSSLPEKIKDRILKQIPMKSFGVPDDIGKSVSFLLGSGGNYMTGQVLHVNGGLHM